MSKKEESIFIKKYVEILRFKSLVKNQKIKIIKPGKSKDNDNKIKLPFIKIIKKNDSSTSRVPVSTTINKTSNNEKNSKESKDVKSIKEYGKDKNFIRFTEDNSKKSIKVISNDLYQRLLQNNPKLDILEKSSSAGNIHEDLMNSS